MKNFKKLRQEIKKQRVSDKYLDGIYMITDEQLDKIEEHIKEIIKSAPTPNPSDSWETQCEKLNDWKLKQLKGGIIHEIIMIAKRHRQGEVSFRELQEEVT